MSKTVIREAIAQIGEYARVEAVKLEGWRFLVWKAALVLGAALLTEISIPFGGYLLVHARDDGTYAFLDVILALLNSLMLIAPAGIISFAIGRFFFPEENESPSKVQRIVSSFRSLLTALMLLGFLAICSEVSISLGYFSAAPMIRDFVNSYAEDIGESRGDNPESLDDIQHDSWFFGLGRSFHPATYQQMFSPHLLATQGSWIQWLSLISAVAFGLYAHELRRGFAMRHKHHHFLRIATAADALRLKYAELDATQAAFDGLDHLALPLMNAARDQSLSAYLGGLDFYDQTFIEGPLYKADPSILERGFQQEQVIGGLIHHNNATARALAERITQCRRSAETLWQSNGQHATPLMLSPPVTQGDDH